jgi:predicted Zn-dependent protease
MSKKIRFSFIVGVFLILQPVFLSGQVLNSDHANSLFSAMDGIFNAEQPMNPEEEYYLGRAVAANILAIYKPYTSNTTLTNYLNLICQALVINSDQPAVYNGYHVMILDSAELNAFSTPGGHIFITRGFIDIAPSEDALAGIIAHELAHVMLKHGLKMIKDMRITSEADSMAAQAAAFAGKSNKDVSSFRNSVSGFLDVIIKSGYSQPQEFEADTLAVKLLTNTGYSPNGLLEILNVLKTVQSDQSGGILASHPATSERITNVQKHTASYKTADNGSVRKERFFRIMER